MKVKSLFSLSCLMLAQAACASSVIPSGAGYFQTTNIDGSTGMTDGTYYPLLAAPTSVSVTTTAQNPNAPVAPFRLHSWLGGMLWGTGQNSSEYWLPDATFSTWVQQNFRQHPVWADPVILEYMQPPGAQGSDPTSRGINLCAPFPFYIPDASYSPSCGSDWTTAPLQLLAVSQYNLLVVPTNTYPSDPGPTTPAWSPNALLVDRMGDWDVDLVYQDPSNPYHKTAFSEAGKGNYLKCTMAQGSPYVYFESHGARYVALSNRMAAQISLATTEMPVPGVIGVSYAIIGGNQNNPGIFNAGNTLNPSGSQDNFTTWAIYFKTGSLAFAPGNSQTSPQNSVLVFSNNGKDKTWFVIAALPTVYSYPTQGQTYSQVTGSSPYNVNAYAQLLGKYAFNFLTSTQISYSVTDLSTVSTTFQTTLQNPYANPKMVSGNNTVMCLMPHHYQNQLFENSVTPTVLNLNGSTVLTPPASASGLFYWSLRGNLQAIVGNSFQTNYIFNNFLPGMPTPAWGTTVTNTTNGFTSSLGQLLFDNIDNNYITNLSNPAFAPWNTAYFTQNRGVYDVGKALSQSAKQLSLLLQMVQACENNDPTFVPGLVERQYNANCSLQLRPGNFNTACPMPSASKLIAMQGGLQSSVSGGMSAGNQLYGLQGAISNYFSPGMNPVISTGGYLLSHYACYDPVGHDVVLFPSSGSPGYSLPFPSRISNPPPHTTPAATLWEVFGVSDANNDHHYQYGYWIASAALAAMYDGAWTNPPTSGGMWGSSAQYGQAIDQLVMDLAYDPNIASSYYTNSQMTFAKLNFFDQWAGHGWADGIQATIAGGNGHNENSIQEGNQAYASIILWGMATGRKEITNLGIYLYTTSTFAADSYFYDKNLNYMPGNAAGFFVPVTTATGNPTYPAGKTFWDYTIHTSTSSGSPKIEQSGINYSTDFGQTPENVKFINAFPCAAWTLAIARNPTYMNAWNASMDTDAFRSTIQTMNAPCWVISDVSNMNMLRSLGSNTIAFGTTDTSIDPLQFMVNTFTAEFSGDYDTSVPWGSTQSAFADPSQSINEVLQFMYTVDAYGPPDWRLYAHAIPDGTTLVYTAAFSQNGTTTYFAFNPSLAEISVQFYKIGSTTALLPTALSVPPKRWAQVTGVTPP